MASAEADNVGASANPLSADPSRVRLSLRAGLPLIASGYSYRNLWPRWMTWRDSQMEAQMPVADAEPTISENARWL